MDLYQIWFRVSSRGHNQLCGILLLSAHGFRFCEGSKFAISHWLGRSPLTQCWRYRAACDTALDLRASTAPASLAYELNILDVTRLRSFKLHRRAGLCQFLLVIYGRPKCVYFVLLMPYSTSSIGVTLKSGLWVLKIIGNNGVRYVYKHAKNLVTNAFINVFDWNVYYIFDFFRAMLCTRPMLSCGVRSSVRPSVTFVDSIKMNKISSNFFTVG